MSRLIIIGFLVAIFSLIAIFVCIGRRNSCDYERIDAPVRPVQQGSISDYDTSAIHEVILNGPVHSQDDVLEMSMDGLYQLRCSRPLDASKEVPVAENEALNIATGWVKSSFINNDARYSYIIDSVPQSPKQLPESSRLARDYDWFVRIKQKFLDIDIVDCGHSLWIEGRRVIVAVGRNCKSPEKWQSAKVPVCSEVEAMSAILGHMRRSPWMESKEIDSYIKAATLERVWVVDEREEGSNDNRATRLLRPTWVVKGRASLFVDAESMKVEVR